MYVSFTARVGPRPQSTGVAKRRLFIFILSFLQYEYINYIILAKQCCGGSAKPGPERGRTESPPLACIFESSRPPVSCLYLTLTLYMFVIPLYPCHYLYLIISSHFHFAADPHCIPMYPPLYPSCMRCIPLYLTVFHRVENGMWIRPKIHSRGGGLPKAERRATRHSRRHMRPPHHIHSTSTGVAPAP